MDFLELKQRVDHSNRALDQYRIAMARDVQQFAGNNALGGYLDRLVDGGTIAGEFDGGRPLVNMLEVLVGIYMQKLVSGNPQCLISSTDPALKTTSRYFTLAMNRIITQIGLDANLKLGVLQSLFSIGVMKVGITLEDEGQYGSSWHYSAIPYADPISFTDYVFDTSAERWDLIRWEGNYYYDFLEDVQNDPRNDPAVVRGLAPGKGVMFDQANPLEDAMLAMGGGGGIARDGANEDFVRLIDVYVPREKIFVTYAANDDRPLRTQKYVGPERGPYHRLFYMPVVGRLMPIPPTKTAAPMANLIDLLWKDMGKQASRQKTVLLCTEGDNGERDAMRINAAADGQAIAVSDPKSCQESATGGVAQATLAFSAAARDWFSYVAGNLDTLGGLSNAAPTLGQEQLLSSSSNGKMQSMQGEVVKWTTSIIKSLAWYVWSDPDCRIRTLDKISGTDIEVPVQFPVRQREDGSEVDDRKGKSHSDFTFDVSPFSLQATTPSQQMQVIDSVVTTLMPALQLMAADGISLDWTEYISAKAEMLNMPRLKDILKTSVPDQQPADGPEFEKPPKPADSRRTYIRERGSGQSSSGANRAMAAAMGSGPAAGGSKQ